MGFWNDVTLPWKEPMFGDDAAFWRAHASWNTAMAGIADEGDEAEFHRAEAAEDRAEAEEAGPLA